MKIRFRTGQGALSCACGCGTAIERGDRSVWLGQRGPYRFECGLETLRCERVRQHSEMSRLMRTVRDAMGVGPLIAGWRGTEPVRLIRAGTGGGPPLGNQNARRISA